MSKDISLIGGINSFGVPYTRDNRKHLSHFHVVEKYLKDLSYNVTSMDMYSMSKYNTTKVLDDYLEKNISYAKIKNNQAEGIDVCRTKGFFQWLQLSPKTSKLYKVQEKDKKIYLTDELKKNSIFIYSCGANDFFEIMNTDLRKLLRISEMNKVFQNINFSISKIIFKIKQNIDRITKYNSKVEIYLLGLYLPTNVSYIRKRTTTPIALFNKELAKLCVSYKNVYFVDNSNLTKKDMAPIDWHPNAKGQKMIGENIIKSIEENSKKVK